MLVQRRGRMSCVAVYILKGENVIGRVTMWRVASVEEGSDVMSGCIYL